MHKLLQLMVLLPPTPHTSITDDLISPASPVFSCRDYRQNTLKTKVITGITEEITSKRRIQLNIKILKDLNQLAPDHFLEEGLPAKEGHIHSKCAPNVVPVPPSER